jgi:hypothetical protein
MSNLNHTNRRKAAYKKGYEAGKAEASTTPQSTPATLRLLQSLINGHLDPDGMVLPETASRIAYVNEKGEVHLNGHFIYLLYRARAVLSGDQANAATRFEEADFYWRTMDPDDSGEYPQDCINRAGLGLYCVAEIASSFTGPKRFGFVAPVLDIHSDEEEFLHFETQAEALEAAAARRETIDALEAERECCIACDVPLEEGDLVYWDASDTGHLHAHCCGPDRSSYVNENGEPLKEDEPIPTPFTWKPDRTAITAQQDASE